MRFLALIQNEIMKINSRKQSLFFLYFCIVFIAGIGIANWLFPELSVSATYLQFAGSLASFVAVFLTLFAIALGAQLMTDEYRDGTIKQLLVRPVSRGAIVLSKYAAACIVIVCIMLILCAAGVVTDWVLFGFDRSGPLTVWTVVRLYLYGVPEAMFMMTLAFFIGTVFRSSSLAITVSAFLYAIGPALSSLLPERWGAKYVVFNNLTLAVYDPNPLVSGGSEAPFPGMTFGFSVSMIVVYTIFLLLVQVFLFKKIEA